MMQVDSISVDIEALQGVANFPARIKCATLAWKALEKVLKRIKSNEIGYYFL